MDDQEKITKNGLIIAAIAWFIGIFFLIQKTSCMKWNNCDGSEVIGFTFISIVGLIPAYWIGLFFSSTNRFKDKK